MDKKPNEMTIKELEKVIPKMSDDELRAAYLAETETDGHDPRVGATDAIKAEAESRGELEAMTRPSAPSSDGELAAETPVAQQTKATEGELEDGAEAILKLEDCVRDLESRIRDGDALDELAKRLDALEGADAPIGDGNARAEILKLHRQLEALANHHNFRLPA